MKTVMITLSTLLIAIQVLAYVGSAHTGMNPLMLPFVGFIAYNVLGIIGVSLAFAATKVK